MPRQLDPRLKEILIQYHPDPRSAVWDCHGTWVIYHKDVEIIAAKAGIRFDPPIIIEADGKNKSVAVCVVAKMGELADWAVGEASPANCKNAYPFAMASKRARDRAAIQLLGLQGLYSEEEADTFRQLPDPPHDRQTGEIQSDNFVEGFVTGTAVKSSAQSKKDGDWDKLRLTLDTADNGLTLLAWPLVHSELLATIKPAWREQVSELWRTAFTEAMASECTTPAECKHFGVEYAKAFEALPTEYLTHAREAWKQVYHDVSELVAREPA